MADRQRVAYRGVDLIARAYGSIVRGKAWRSGKELGSVEGATEAEVLSKLRELVDSAFTVETDVSHSIYPSEDAYREALVALWGGLPETYRSMLRAHYLAPGRVMTARQLAEAAGYSEWTSANLHYGKLGRMIGELLLFQPRPRKTGEPIWTLVLAAGADDETPEEEWRWKLRNEVAAALESEKLV